MVLLLFLVGGAEKDGEVMGGKLTTAIRSLDDAIMDLLGVAQLIRVVRTDKAYIANETLATAWNEVHVRLSLLCLSWASSQGLNKTSSSMIHGALCRCEQSKLPYTPLPYSVTPLEFVVSLKKKVSSAQIMRSLRSLLLSTSLQDRHPTLPVYLWPVTTIPSTGLPPRRQ
jgi:hypothetical protein